MGVVERLGHAGAEPTHGLKIVRFREQLAITQCRRVKHRGVLTVAIDRVQYGLAAPARSILFVQRLDDPFECCARHVLHAEHALVSRRIDGLRKNLDDVIVFEAGQRPRLAAAVGRDFQRDLPIE
jgi:hypothetical protein